MGTLKVKGGPGVTTTGYGNTIEIAVASNAPAVPFKITNFSSSGTWTKDPSTTLVTIFLWCGGGGGGAGSAVSAHGGGGGSQGSVYYVDKEPAATFGATESIVIGAGGTGGAVPGANGTQGGVTSFGTFIVPGAQNNYGRPSTPGPSMPLVLDVEYPKTPYYSGGAYGEAATGENSVYRTASDIQLQNASLVPTGGGGGGGDTGPTQYRGGSSGAILAANGATIVAGAAGGAGGIPGSAGGNGSNGILYNGIQTGGTGGGGGGCANASGGRGGFPGAGGGGGGAAHTPFLAGPGGNGAAGYVIVWEYH